MNYSAEEKASWDRAIELMREGMDVASFNAWIKPISLYAISGDTMFITTPIPLALPRLRTRYAATLGNAVYQIFRRGYELEFYMESEAALIDEKINVLHTTTLNPKYTFENFITGNSNSFAYAASLAVAEEPAQVYNPLFIYGGVGLGKTHLMNAVGNYITQADNSANVLLMTSETITNELIEAIGKKKTAELRAKMRKVDVLMVDDIQFLARTKTTQEEFFHTFNDLYNNGKQIIISSDRPPKEIPEIEERLRSRFEWGLIVDIQKPDLETRMAILRSKAEEEGIDIPYDVVEYIAQNVNSNIRELEGCLTSLDARAQLMNAPISLDFARAALANRINEQSARKVSPELIIEVVAQQYSLSPEDVTGKKRSREIAMPRQIAMYICREMTSLSTTSIGRAFGDRDHTTVMHGCDKIAELIRNDFAFKKRVEEIMGLVKGN